MALNNKEIGNKFEKEMADWLCRQGYWVHFCHPAPDGSQPFDLIAAKGSYDGKAMIIAVDCKTLNGNSKNFDGLRFPLNRIEDNQETAFEKMNSRGIHNTYFAIKFNNTQAVFAPSQLLISKKQQGEKSIRIGELTGYGIINLK